MTRHHRNPENANENISTKKDLLRLKEEINEQQRKYINLQVKLFDYLDQHQYTNQREILMIFQEDNLSSQEIELLKRFCENLERRIKRTKQIVEKFRRIGKASIDHENPSDSEVAEEAGKTLFYCLTGRYPSGDVQLIDFGHACGLRTSNKDDFGLLYKNAEVGGIYSAKTSFSNLKTAIIFKVNIFQKFPFIAFGPNENYITEKHETTHGVNRIIFDALTDFSSSLEQEIWGGRSKEGDRDTLISQTKATLNQIASQALKTESSKNQENDPKQIALQIEQSIANYLPYALSRAKDEVLADFVASGNFEHVNSLYHSTFTPNQSSIIVNTLSGYQYLREAGLDKDTFSTTDTLKDAYSIVIDKYNNTLRHNTAYMNSLVKTWREFPEMQDKVKELIAFMRQNPIDTWESRGRRLFGTEFSHLRQISDRYDAQISEFDRQEQNFIHLKRQVTQFSSETHDPEINQDNELLLSLIARYEAYIQRIRKDQLVKSVDDISPEQVEKFKGILTKLQIRYEEFRQKHNQIVEENDTRIQSLIDTHPIEIFLRTNKQDVDFIQKHIDQAVIQLTDQKEMINTLIQEALKNILTPQGKPRLIRGNGVDEILRSAKDIVFSRNWGTDFAELQKHIKSYQFDEEVTQQIIQIIQRHQDEIQQINSTRNQLHELLTFYIKIGDELTLILQENLKQYLGVFNQNPQEKFNWLNLAQSVLSLEQNRFIVDKIHVRETLPAKIKALLSPLPYTPVVPQH